MDNFTSIENMVREAERHADAMSSDRVRATEYYRGEMKDTPSDKGRSRMVKRVIRAQIKKVLPSIVRTILGGDEIIEYQPIGVGDEERAQQASDYVNYVIMPECGGKKVISDAIHDALLLRNGILKWWWDERLCVKISRHSGLTDDAMAALAGDDDVEVLEHSQKVEKVEKDGQFASVTLHDVKIRRSLWDRRVKVAAVPRERFLVHPDAVALQESPLTGEKTTVRRSELVAMGYDRDMVYGLSMSSEDDEYEESVRRDTALTGEDEVFKANEEVDYYDLYIMVDMDGDGIAELRHMCFAGGLKEKNLLVNDECDEVQFCDVRVMDQPHQWEGVAVSDDLMDLQQAETVLLRQTLDNIYWQNNPQPVMQEQSIKNPDAVYSPEFGLPIRVQQGVDVRAALGFNSVPFIARDSFGMLEYLDGEATDRTGISDASSGMAPDALQNMTAKATALIEQAGIGQTELMVRTVSEGLRVLFRGLLRLIIRHQDVPRTVRLRDEWVTFDPRDWNSDMDCTVNTGLGAGTRERDMMVMMQIMGIQEKLLAGFGPNNPFVKPENIYAAVSKVVESAGLKTPGLYFTEPDPQEVKALLQAQANKPSPEMEKVKANAEARSAELQLQAQVDSARVAADMQMKREQQTAEMQLKREQMAAELQLRREQILAEVELKKEQLALEASIRIAAPSHGVGSDVRFGGAVG